MSEAVNTKYFEVSDTYSPMAGTGPEYQKTTEETISTLENEITQPSVGSLIDQNIIKMDDYRKIRATRKVIGHVHFEPD